MVKTRLPVVNLTREQLPGVRIMLHRVNIARDRVILSYLIWIEKNTQDKLTLCRVTKKKSSQVSFTQGKDNFTRSKLGGLFDFTHRINKYHVTKDN